MNHPGEGDVPPLRARRGRPQPGEGVPPSVSCLLTPVSWILVRFSFLNSRTSGASGIEYPPFCTGCHLSRDYSRSAWADCLPNAIAPTSACLRGRVTTCRPGVLLPAFTHHPFGLVFSLLRLASRRPCDRHGPPCCFGGLVYSAPKARKGVGKFLWRVRDAPATPGSQNPVGETGFEPVTSRM